MVAAEAGSTPSTSRQNELQRERTGQTVHVFIFFRAHLFFFDVKTFVAECIKLWI